MGEHNVSQLGVVAQEIKSALADLSAQYFDLENESKNHAGYYPGKESHFKIVIVSEDFAGKRRVARHQMIYSRVSALLTVSGGEIHALALHAYTPDEWQDIQNAPDSPQCAGRRLENI
ncbi:BolA family transcriptional regulator [Cardiobacteriaceae bacterium TAE3-ERU3]|nr:BolA family transcriptional regulator [Cardiobacteriaceae bacterium TAE3-ERU3]